jgi:hypothetical protein
MLGWGRAPSRHQPGPRGPACLQDLPHDLQLGQHLLEAGTCLGVGGKAAPHQGGERALRQAAAGVCGGWRGTTAHAASMKGDCLMIVCSSPIRIASLAAATVRARAHCGGMWGDTCTPAAPTLSTTRMSVNTVFSSNVPPGVRTYGCTHSDKRRAHTHAVQRMHEGWKPEGRKTV